MFLQRYKYVVYLVDRNVGPVPGGEQYTAVSAVSGPRSLVLTAGAVPCLVGDTMDSTNLEERLKLVLVSSRHGR